MYCSASANIPPRASPNLHPGSGKRSSQTIRCAPLHTDWTDKKRRLRLNAYALQRGVKGGKWHSLIDKVWHPDTLMLAWTQVERNAGAAGVDRVSVERFAQARDYYLAELASTLRDGSYRPQAVRRVYIPKGKGQRPL